MDRNSIIGLVLIFAIFVGFSYWNAPSPEEIEARQRKQDSIAEVQQQFRIQDSIRQIQQQENLEEAQTNTIVETSDSSEFYQQLKDKFGVFAESSQGENTKIQVENDVMKLDFQSLGGMIYRAQLKKYKSHDSLPLVLFRADTAKFGFVFSAANRIINTQDHYFKTYVNGKEFSGEKVSVSGNDSLNVSLRLYADQSNTFNPNQYIEYSYTILETNTCLISISE